MKHLIITATMIIAIAGTTVAGSCHLTDLPPEKKENPTSAQVDKIRHTSVLNNVLSTKELRSLWTLTKVDTVREDIQLYYVITNPIQFKKICWLPFKRASYSLNIPPATRLIYLSKTSHGPYRFQVDGYHNKTLSWVHVSVINDGRSIRFATGGNNRFS